MAGRMAASETDVFKVIGILNNQPDVLTAIVKSRLPDDPRTKGHLGDLYIMDVDTDGHWVRLALRPPPTREEVEVKIPFDPPVKTGWDVRPRLFAWRAEARRKYNIPEHPTVDYFKRPPMFPFTLPLGGSLLVLLVLFFGEGKSQLIDDARQWIGERAGFSTITICTWFAAFMHLLAEPALMIWMTGRHRVPLGPRLKWLAWNVAIGWGAIDEFFECTLYEKVRHVYKQTDVGDIGPNVKDAVSKEKKTQ
ncbi:hypothetical protein CC85DRAFT_288823 [Cutaneotrichosporon oleaginosum]|uniref:Uncharacterized protein n=1 Tax=Cutaneotrichosporon oleaginosum TaxID=879819 RepID=A0A0J0XDJ3_9TREE|nr:uncharacterized protein CC85DRAFT_288823 [Cutaneotrichosporon oleaginosum]KLT39165.1 hypothetical protein CC85DRAFT_288823 [Cutaneotrichosporon oleaginosum]TXT05317.1 hypothetical protein COLE_06637 [Cutaneotrichosporon oleaginosum]